MTDIDDKLEHPLADPTSSAPAPVHRSTKGHVRSTAGTRQCGATLCSTVLSRYNDTGTCWVHGASNSGPLRRPL